MPPLLQLSNRALLAGFGLGLSLVDAQQQQQQAPALPDFFTSELKDEWGDLDSMEPAYGEDACGKRTQMLKTMSTISNPQMGHYKATVLEDLGFCAIKMEDYAMAKTRFQSAISELEMVTHRSELDFLKIPQLQFYAPLVFNRNAAQAMSKGLFGDAGMSFRRTNTVYQRNIDKEVKIVAKHNKIATKEELANNFEAVKQKILPQMQQHRAFRLIMEKSALGTDLLKRIDKAVGYNSQRQRTLSTDKYLPGLLYKDTLWKGGHRLSEDLKSLKWPKSIPDARQVPLVIPNKNVVKDPKAKSKDVLPATCDKGVWKEFCDLMTTKKYFADLASNVFGGAKILNGKKTGEFQKLESCESNAVIGLLWSEKPFKLTFPATKTGSNPSPEEKAEVAANEPTYLNFCRPVEISREGPVLFVQLWHPEVASIERTQLIRNFSKDKEQGNHLAKLVNDASAEWEKSKKLWQQVDNLSQHSSLTHADLETEAKKAAKSKEEEKKQALEEDSEEARKKAVEELEKKRKENAEKAEAKKERIRKNAERAAQQKKQEAPWIDTVIKMKNKESGEKEETTLKKEQEKLEEYKAEKRELDRNLEFGQAKDMVSYINEQERRVKSADKLAKKAYKKAEKASATGGAAKSEEKPAAKSEEKAAPTDKKREDVASGSTKTKATKVAEPKTETKAAAEPTAKKADLLKQKKEALEKVNTAKKAAAKKEDFKKAKTLKADAKRLEEEITKLEGEMKIEL